MPNLSAMAIIWQRLLGTNIPEFNFFWFLACFQGLGANAYMYAVSLVPRVLHDTPQRFVFYRVFLPCPLAEVSSANNFAAIASKARDRLSAIAA